MDVTDSDHKPVRCIFNVKIAHGDKSVRRREFGRIYRSNEKIRSILEGLSYIPETTVSTNNIVLQNQESTIVRITNKYAKDMVIYKIMCEGQSTVKEDGETPELRPRGGFGLPRWLEVLCSAFCLHKLFIFFSPTWTPYKILNYFYISVSRSKSPWQYPMIEAQISAIYHKYLVSCTMS